MSVPWRPTVTKVREGRPPPAPRLKQTMRDLANEYERLLQERPGAASDHYAANGQGTPTPLLDLPYDWTAVPDGMHVVHPPRVCCVSVCRDEVLGTPDQPHNYRSKISSSVSSTSPKAMTIPPTRWPTSKRSSASSKHQRKVGIPPTMWPAIQHCQLSIVLRPRCRAKTESTCVTMPESLLNCVASNSVLLSRNMATLAGTYCVMLVLVVYCRGRMTRGRTPAPSRSRRGGKSRITTASSTCFVVCAVCAS